MKTGPVKPSTVTSNAWVSVPARFLALISIWTAPSLCGVQVTTPLVAWTMKSSGPDTTAKVSGVIPLAVTV